MYQVILVKKAMQIVRTQVAFIKKINLRRKPVNERLSHEKAILQDSLLSNTRDATS